MCMSRTSTCETGIKMRRSQSLVMDAFCAAAVDLYMAQCDMQVALYLNDGSPAPSYPVAGQRFMPLRIGDVVDVVIQNMAANANGAPHYWHHSQ